MDASTDLPNLLFLVGVLGGMVLVFRRYLPDFRRDYGEERGFALLVLYMVWFPAFLFAVLSGRRKSPKVEAKSAASEDERKSKGGWGTV